MINLTLRSRAEDNMVITYVTGVYKGKPVAYRSTSPEGIPIGIKRLIEINDDLYLNCRPKRDEIKTRFVEE